MREEKEALLQGVVDLHSRAVQAAARSKLPPTAPRAGKVQRRQAGRPEGQRKVTALQTGRKHNSKRPLAQQADSYGDEFKPQAKKGRTADKVSVWSRTTYKCGTQRGCAACLAETCQYCGHAHLTEHCIMLLAAGARRDH